MSTIIKDEIYKELEVNGVNPDLFYSQVSKREDILKFHDLVESRKSLESKILRYCYDYVEKNNSQKKSKVKYWAICFLVLTFLVLIGFNLYLYLTLFLIAALFGGIFYYLNLLFKNIDKEKDFVINLREKLERLDDLDVQIKINQCMSYYESIYELLPIFQMMDEDIEPLIDAAIFKMEKISSNKISEIIIRDGLFKHDLNDVRKMLAI